MSMLWRLARFKTSTGSLASRNAQASVCLQRNASSEEFVGSWQGHERGQKSVIFGLPERWKCLKILAPRHGFEPRYP